MQSTVVLISSPADRQIAGDGQSHARRSQRALGHTRTALGVRMMCILRARAAARVAARPAAARLLRRSRGSTRCCAEGGRRLVLADAPASVWSAKPAWCQPWTIVGTGAGVVAATEGLLHWWLLTAAVTAAVAAWWYIFLGVYSRQYEEALRAARAGDQRAEAWVLGLLESFAYDGSPAKAEEEEEATGAS